MKRRSPPFAVIMLILSFLCGCAHRESSADRHLLAGSAGEEGAKNIAIPEALEDEILALDPESITGDDVAGVLSRCPAPRIINLDGSVPLVTMESFSKFLILMGYPEESVRDPKTGAYTYSSYMSSRKLAGLLAWHYEREGMMPMVIGHSQGGMLSVKVLHEFAGTFRETIEVWNAQSDKPEERYTIRDPLTGDFRSVTGLKVGFASAIATGKSMRILLGQWEMLPRLREIPDTVEEFTGFRIENDFIGSDFFGLVQAKRYYPLGSARVRNITLPAGYSHLRVPLTEELAKRDDTREWINAYRPSSESPELTGAFQSKTDNILFAADVWHSIKKYWCVELQRLVAARREERSRNRSDSALKISPLPAFEEETDPSLRER